MECALHIRRVMRYLTVTRMLLVSTLFALGGCAAESADPDVGDVSGAQTPADAAERSAVMNALRAKLQPSMGGQQIVFNVSRGHYAMAGGYVFLRGQIQLKAGGTPKIEGTAYAGLAAEGIFDGFHVEAVLRKDGASWRVLEHGVGSTDVWWSGLSEQYAEAPDAIWDDLARSPRTPALRALHAKLAPTMGGQAFGIDIREGHFELEGDWAFVTGRLVSRGASEQLQTGGTAYAQLASEGLFDGFQVQALLRKEGTTWRVLEEGVGSTDVWWSGLAAKYPSAPARIWDPLAAMK